MRRRQLCGEPSSASEGACAKVLRSAQVQLDVVRGHGASKGGKGRKWHEAMPGDQSGQAV